MKTCFKAKLRNWLDFDFQITAIIQTTYLMQILTHSFFFKKKEKKKTCSSVKKKHGETISKIQKQIIYYFPPTVNPDTYSINSIYYI